ncbi:uncharacterized protein ARB_00320 [Trichophyton benhamiae CBS 112371]|uniref:Uncharacterized protein n=1 Tax=Arthroderma benhamiae (strain ATCC MYA-4681 / CBS 112371) TaxID=663331 RepID=D4AVV6_ARTBC|nr:uncharacterized protein ARB_00320 [Trichophyton benhamiae CBS 112371]EFE32862.1 hypothetical protein ARB_00320 [Trichophyton benhamiae CBS 112371]
MEWSLWIEWTKKLRQSYDFHLLKWVHKYLGGCPSSPIFKTLSTIAFEDYRLQGKILLGPLTMVTKKGPYSSRSGKSAVPDFLAYNGSKAQKLPEYGERDWKRYATGSLRPPDGYASSAKSRTSKAYGSSSRALDIPGSSSRAPDPLALPTSTALVPYTGGQKYYDNALAAGSSNSRRDYDRPPTAGGSRRRSLFFGDEGNALIASRGGKDYDRLPTPGRSSRRRVHFDYERDDRRSSSRARRRRRRRQRESERTDLAICCRDCCTLAPRAKIPPLLPEYGPVSDATLYQLHMVSGIPLYRLEYLSDYDLITEGPCGSLGILFPLLPCDIRDAISSGQFSIRPVQVATVTTVNVYTTYELY